MITPKTNTPADEPKELLPAMLGVTISDARMSIEFPMWKRENLYTGLIERGHTGERVYEFQATYTCPPSLASAFKAFLLEYMEKGIVREVVITGQAFDVKGRVSTQTY